MNVKNLGSHKKFIEWLQDFNGSKLTLDDEGVNNFVEAAFWQQFILRYLKIDGSTHTCFASFNKKDLVEELHGIMNNSVSMFRFLYEAKDQQKAIIQDVKNSLPELVDPHILAATKEILSEQCNTAEKKPSEENYAEKLKAAKELLKSMNEKYDSMSELYDSMNELYEELDTLIKIKGK